MAASNCSPEVPYSSDVLADGDPSNVALLVISGVLMIAVLGVFIGHLVYIRRHLWTWHSRNHLICLLAVYPAFAWLSFLGLLVPRSITLIDLVSAVYLSVCIKVFLRLMISYYGGADQMVSTLSEHVLVLRSPPCCCCLCCLPKIPLTPKVLTRINISVFQLVIIRPILMMTAAVLWTDGLYNSGKIAADEPFTYITVLNFISTFTAMYGLVLVYRVSRLPLRKHHITPKFISLQLVILFSNLQNNIISLVQNAGGIPCVPPFNSVVRGQRINHFALVIEMSLLSCLATWAYRKERYLPKSAQTDDVEQHEELLDDSVNATTNGYGTHGTYEPIERK